MQSDAPKVVTHMQSVLCGKRNFIELLKVRVPRRRGDDGVSRGRVSESERQGTVRTTAEVSGMPLLNGATAKGGVASELEKARDSPLDSLTRT